MRYDVAENESRWIGTRNRDPETGRKEGWSMSRTEAITLLGRLFAIYLCIWAIVDFTYLLDYLFSAWHYLVESNSTASHDYWAEHYRLLTGLAALRTLGLLATARFFWKGGPKLEELLWSVPEESGDRR